jgi:hypothetical protein
MSKMLDQFMNSFERNVVEGKDVVQEKLREEAELARTRALEEAKLAEEQQKLLERRKTRLGELAANLKYLPMVEQIIDMHYLADGITVFARTTDGNAYEFMIRPAEYAKGFSTYRKPSKPKAEPVTERNGNHAAHIVVKPSDATHPDDDGAVERSPKDKDVKKNLKQVAKDYDVHYVKDFAKYTKNR